MANNKSLMENISKDVNEIKKAKKFGPKLPSNEDQLTKAQINSVSYEQMIMGTLSSLVWGKKNITKDQQVKSLLGANKNIFNYIEDFIISWKEDFLNSYNGYIFESIEYIENIKKNTETLVTTLQSIDERQKLMFEEIQKLNNASNVQNIHGYIFDSIEYIENIKKNTETLVTTLQSIDERQKLMFEEIQKLNNASNAQNIQNTQANNSTLIHEDKKNNKSELNIVIGAADGNKSNIIDFLENLCDPKKFDKNNIKNIKSNLRELSDLISNSKVKNSLKSIFASINDIISDYNNEKDLDSLNDALNSIISIITIDKEKLSLDGIHLLKQITDPKHGYLYHIFKNIEEITKNLKINNDTITTISDFFDAIITICELREYSFADLIKIGIKLELIKYIIQDIIVGSKEDKDGLIYAFDNVNSRHLASMINKVTLLNDIFDNLSVAFDSLPTIKSILATVIKFGILLYSAPIIEQSVEAYNGIISELLKIKLTTHDKKKIDNIINTITSLASIKISILSMRTLKPALKLLHKSVNEIKEIVDDLKEIDSNDLKNSIAVMNEFNKFVLIAAAVMIGGALAMSLINPLDLIVFTLCLGGFVWGLSKIYKSVSKDIGEATFESAEQFSKLVAISGLILIAGGLVMKLINTADLFAFALSLGIFVILISAAYKIVSQSEEATLDSAENFSKLIAISAATLLVGALAFKYLWAPAIGFGILLSLFIGAVTLAYTITARNSEVLESADKFAKLIAISALTLMIGGIFMLSDKLAIGAIKFAVLLVAFIGLVSLSMRLLPKDTKNILAAMIGLSVIIAVSATVLMFGALIMANDKFAWGAVKFALLLAGFITVMALIAAVLNKFEKYIRKGIIIMGLLVIVTIGMAVAIAMVALVARIIPKDIWSKLLVMGAIIVGLAVICGIIGIPTVAACVALGIVVMIGLIAVVVLMSIAFIVLTAAVKYMNTLNEDSITTAFDNIKAAINGLLGLWWPLTKLSAAIVTMIPGIIALFVLSAALSMVAHTIKLWADLRIPVYNATGTDVIGYKTLASEDFVQATSNIKEVVGLLFNAINDVYEENPKLFEFNLTTFLTGKTPIERVISSSMNLGKMLINLAKGIQAWANLRIPIYDNKGKIVGYKTIDDDAFKNAGENIKLVVTTMGQAISDIYDNVQKNANTKGMFESSEWFGLGRTKFSKVVNAMKTMGPMLQSLAKGIQSWADLRIPQYNSKGEITGYQRLTFKELADASAHIKSVLVCIGQAIVETVKDNEKIFGGDDIINNSPAIVAAKAMKIMGEVLNLTAQSVASYASGKFPIFDKDGKFVDYITVKPEDYALAKQHIEEVLTCIGQALITTVESPENKKIFNEGWFTDAPAMVAAEAIKNMSEALNNTITAIKQLSELNLDDLVAALDTNGTDNVYAKLNMLLGSTIDIFKLFVAEDGSTATVGKVKHWWRSDTIEQMSFAEYLDEHNGDIEDAADALGTFTSAINKLLSEYAKIGNIIKTKVKDLTIFEGGVNAYAYKILRSIMITTTQVINMLLDKNRLDKLEDFEDSEDDIKDGINSVISVTTTLLKGIVSIKSLSDKINDYDLFTTLNPLITSFNKSIGLLHQIGYSTSDISDNLGNMQIDKIFDINAKSLNENIKLYSEALKLIIDVNKYAKDAGEEGYNVLKDGILKLYNTTNSIVSNDIFSQHVNDLERYVHSINTIKLDNISSLKGFVDSMNELSKRLGNLDNLTDAVGNKLSQVLYELVLQLRKAEATITNAHTLQDKRKELMEKSIEKINNIMNQHMIVEITQVSKEELKERSQNSYRSPSEAPSTGRINSNKVDDGNPTGTDENSSKLDEASNKSSKLPNPENEKASTGIGKDKVSTKQGSGYNTSDMLTFDAFKQYMEKQYLNKIKNIRNGE